MGDSRNSGLGAPERALLRSRGWLARQPAEFGDTVLDMCVSLHIEAGEAVFNLGDDPGGLYGLVDGWLDILIAPGSLQPTLVHVATTGWWFGDSALLTQTPRRGAHIARTGCRLAVLPGDAVERLQRQGFDPWRRVAHISVGVIDHAFAVIAANRFHEPLQRAALTLRILLGDGHLFAAGAPLKPPSLPISQIEFAEIANLSRNAAGDALRALAKEGAIRLGYREIEVLDVDALTVRSVQ